MMKSEQLLDQAKLQAQERQDFSIAPDVAEVDMPVVDGPEADTDPNEDHSQFHLVQRQAFHQKSIKKKPRNNTA